MAFQKGVMSTQDLLEAFNLRSFARRWRRCYFNPRLSEGIPFKKTLLIPENISCNILCTTTRRSFKYCILEKDFSEVYLIIRPVEGTYSWNTLGIILCTEYLWDFFNMQKVFSGSFIYRNPHWLFTDHRRRNRLYPLKTLHLIFTREYRHLEGSLWE